MVFHDVGVGGVSEGRGEQGCGGSRSSSSRADLKGNLFKLWNRLSAGSYFPPTVRAVEIPKSGKPNEVRTLWVPTVADRIAQTVVHMVLEPEAVPQFHPDSYGYRPGRLARDALAVTRKRCWENDWVVDMDIRAFFDTIDHGLLMRAVERHTSLP